MEIPRTYWERSREEGKGGPADRKREVALVVTFLDDNDALFATEQIN